MPSYLDFDSTKRFRDFILGKTLQQPNGPQTFTNNLYDYQNLSNMSNVDPGTVDNNVADELLQSQNSNIYKPLQYFVKDTIDVLPRRANLSLYPYFVVSNHNLIGIMTSNSTYNTESELFKFAANYIKNDKGGPVLSRLAQNLEASTVGRVRLIDALNGNTATASNIITGREPLVESNYKITVAKTLLGKGVDFLQTVSGLQFPFTEIPGSYLSDPRNPINYRPTPSTEFGKIVQDVTGVLGSLIGIQRRPKLSRKPSDLFIEYMGEGQRNNLYDLLSYSKYAPNYTTTARSQNSSKVFNFIDRTAQGIKSLLGAEAPKGEAYIGDDRGNDVKYAMSDFNDRPVRSSYFLSLMFDEVQAKLFQRSKNITEGGLIGGNLTWISKNSKNKLGVNNKEYNDESSNLEDTLSTKYGFRFDSILGQTQELLNTLPTDGGASRSHVANVIDQTSRVFREGDNMMSRGSAIKYVDKFTGEESGVEYCRVWTKDRSYMNYSDTMKRTDNIRKFDGSVMGGQSRPWNLNIGPMSNGNKGFDGSTNIVNGYKFGADKDGKSFYAKKYMFSIENLAWKTSMLPGFTVLDLPFCERGPNGGRVMWFPPYDLKVSEQNSAKWETNNFLGRPEPIYTYQNTERSGQISFKVVVDHPSILNLLVREHFKGMSDEEADNYINAFFAGCEELDFYGLIRRYTTLDKSDIDLIKDYLNTGGDTKVINKYKTVIDPNVKTNPQEPTPIISSNSQTLHVTLNFENDVPDPNTKNVTSSSNYTDLYLKYKTQKSTYTGRLQNDLVTLLSYVGSQNTTKVKKEKNQIFGTENPVGATLINDQLSKMTKFFDDMDSEFNNYTGKTETLKNDISGKTVQNIKIEISSSTSSVASTLYNEKLSLRRSHSIIKDFFSRISKDGKGPNPKWIDFSNLVDGYNKDGITVNRNGGIIITKEYDLKQDFGWDNPGKITVVSTNYGETFTGNSEDKLNCKNQDFVVVPGLKKHSPIAFWCRNVKVNFKYDKTPEPQKPINPAPTNELPKTKIIEDGVVTVPNKVKKPPIDVMKRIIMKTLSECFYFKKLEEDSPIAFKSLTEKLKYFHPAFHSTTPEGLNARLTFIHQCLRPGDTIPIKGISDNSDIGARNTTFGPPPICILRVGDFYHSKIVIRDVGITFEDGVWDLNPEGIGVQPMIANVTLQINFIGGQGLEKPVERLQNALTSNFYANTEMYDERSILTNTSINGQESSGFTKSFLEKLQEDYNKTPQPSTDEKLNAIDKGKNIGEGTTELNYKNIIEDVFTKTESYFTQYPILYNSLNKKYGTKLLDMIISPTYRTIKTYDVYTTTSNTPGTTIDLFGLYTKTKELPILNRGVKMAMDLSITNSNLCQIFGFDKELTLPKQNKANELLTPEIKKIVNEKLDGIVTDTTVLSFEENTNKLITSLDKVNYLVKYGKDAKVVDDKKTVQSNLSGFTYDLIYNEYSTCIDYIKTNTSKFYNDLDGTINFNNPTIDTPTLSDILTVLLNDSKEKIIEILKKGDSIIFDENTTTRLSKRLDNFFVTPKEKVFKFSKFIKRKNNNDVKFTISNETEITDQNILDETKKLFSTKVSVINKLNYYKK
jgi:hypothetical protein